MIHRRDLIVGLAVLGTDGLARAGGAVDKSFLPQGLPDGVYDTAALEALPGKKPLIKLSYRPPNYETPLSYFTSQFTPNDAFFVRYHLAGIPDEIDPAQWRLTIGGDGVARPLQLTLSDLRTNFEAVELAAVCQCSGNRRGFSSPHVSGSARAAGWTATYWMKHLVSIEAVTKPFAGYWMKNAYRIPAGKFPIVQHFVSQMTRANEPITEMVINAMITTPNDGATLPAGETSEIRGFAWDGGYGIRRVEISTDGGESWREAELGRDVGRFAFRIFRFAFAPPHPGTYHVMARASNTIGQTQASELIFNPAGYNNNVVRPLTVNVA